MSVSARGHHHVLFFFQKSLRQLFWSSFLRQSGFALVDIFTFIYIYRLGIENNFFSLITTSPFQQGIFTVIADVLLLRFIETIVIFPISSFASKLGLPKAAIFGNIVMAIRYALLALSFRYPLLVFSAAIVHGIELSVFGPAYDTMFAKRASMTKVGRDLSSFTFILRLTNALIPAFAGGLIVTLGFSAAFIGATVLLIASNIPLLTIRWKESLSSPTLRDFVSWYRDRVDLKILVAVSGRYISDVGFELWPIYLLLVFGKVERLGLLMSFALFISLLVTYFSGWFIDHSKKNTTFIASGILLALFWLLRINLSVLVFIIVLEVLQKIVESFFYPSFDALVYRISKHVDTFSFHVYREFLISIVSLLFWSVLGIVFYFYGEVWNWLFVIGALGTLASTLLYIARYE